MTLVNQMTIPALCVTLIVVACGLAAPAQAYQPGSSIPDITSCGSAADVLSVSNITWTPYAISPGVNVTITVVGTLRLAVSGGKIDVQSKLDGIPQVPQSVDLCEAGQANGNPCPWGVGGFKTAVNFVLPVLMSGHLAANGVAKTASGQQIACIALDVEF